MRRLTSRQLALRRELLVATAQVQRAELRLALRQGPWTPALGTLRWLRGLARTAAALWKQR